MTLQEQILALQQQLNEQEGSVSFVTITADEGYVFQRIHDNHIMGKVIHLGYDYSLGFKQKDKAGFYRQIKDVVSDN